MGPRSGMLLRPSRDTGGGERPPAPCQQGVAERRQVAASVRALRGSTQISQPPGSGYPLDTIGTEAVMQTLQAQTGFTSRVAGQPSGKTVELAPDVAMACFTMKFARNEEVFVEEEEADFVYKVISGA